MRKMVSCALLINLAGCNTYMPEASRSTAVANRTAFATIGPVRPELSNPTVATGKGLLTYVDDLESCRRQISGSMGGREADDVSAIRRAVAEHPVDGKLTIRYAEGDRAITRDKAVRNCVSGKGHLVMR